MCYRNYDLLRKWYNHHSKIVGASNLFVLSHGNDQKHREIAPLASVIGVPRDDLIDFDSRRNNALNNLQASLSCYYDWAFRTDDDELLVYDPSRYGGLADVCRTSQTGVLFALGLHLLRTEQESELDQNKPYSLQRKFVFPDSHYSKAFGTSEGWASHGHGISVPRRFRETFAPEMPPGFYMVHTKYASQAISAATDLLRENLAAENMAAHGKPGVVRAWSEARLMSDNALKEMLAADTESAGWLNTYREKCLATIQYARRGAVRFGNIDGKNFKTELPEELLGCF